MLFPKHVVELSLPLRLNYRNCVGRLSAVEWACQHPSCKMVEFVAKLKHSSVVNPQLQSASKLFVHTRSLILLFFFTYRYLV